MGQIERDKRLEAARRERFGGWLSSDIRIINPMSYKSLLMLLAPKSSESIRDTTQPLKPEVALSDAFSPQTGKTTPKYKRPAKGKKGSRGKK